MTKTEREAKEELTAAHNAGMTVPEYRAANYAFWAARRLLEEELPQTICSGCCMKDVCDKYGRPESCLKSGANYKWKELIDRLNIDLLK